VRTSRADLPPSGWPEDPRPSGAASALGVALVIAGIGLSPSLLLRALGITGHTGPLWLGAVLFRTGLAMLGLYLLVAGRLAIWHAAARRTGRAAPPSFWAVATVGGILAAALGIRLFRLGAGLWFDEIIEYVEYMHLSFGEILTTYATESQHFLYTLLARAAFALVGEGPASLRLPAALFGVASVAALYLFARQVTSEREAVFSAALLTVSYHHVWFSQNGRGYTALLFWTLLTSWLLLRALDEGRTRLWLAYAGAVALGVFTHITMLFAVLAQASIYAVWLVRHHAAIGATAWRGAVLGFGMAGLLAFQLYAFALPQVWSAIGMTANVPEWTNPAWTLLELARGLEVGFAGRSAAGAALVTLAVGLISVTRTAPVLLVLLVLPAAVGAATVAAMGHPLWPRFFFFLIGFGVLVVVRGAMVIGAAAGRLLGVRPDRTPWAGSALVLLLIIASATTLPPAWLPKQDYLGARRFVDAERQPGDAVVTVGLATFPYRRLYHAGWEEAGSVDALNAIRARAKRTWIVYTIPLQLQGEHPQLMRAIRHGFVPIKEFGGTLNGGTIYVCRAEGVPSPAQITARPGGPG
jgi:mannosyltransferase